MRKRGLEVVVVSSGAVAAGKADLGITGRPPTIPLKQAAAAIGQSRLMRSYKEEFRARDQLVVITSYSIHYTKLYELARSSRVSRTWPTLMPWLRKASL